MCKKDFISTLTIEDIDKAAKLFEEADNVNKGIKEMFDFLEEYAIKKQEGKND